MMPVRGGKRAAQTSGTLADPASVKEAEFSTCWMMGIWTCVIIPSGDEEFVSAFSAAVV